MGEAIIVFVGESSDEDRWRILNVLRAGEAEMVSVLNGRRMKEAVLNCYHLLVPRYLTYPGTSGPLKGQLWSPKLSKVERRPSSICMPKLLKLTE
jgi:hypothetical protein